MKNRYVLIALGALIVFAGVVMSITIDQSSEQVRGAGHSYSDLPTLEELGARFLAGGHLLEQGEFAPAVSEDGAERSAILWVLNRFGPLPDRPEVTDLLQARSTLAIYSGYPSGSRQPDDLRDPATWPIREREVWVVIVDNLPISIRFGAPDMEIDTDEFPSPRALIVVDAATGEVINSATQGAGPRNPEWEPVLEAIRADMEPPSRDEQHTATPARY